MRLSTRHSRRAGGRRISSRLVCIIIRVCASQLVRPSGPSIASMKSFCALIWSSQLIGGVSSEAPIVAF
jgi:hypothetical protein